MDWQDLLKRVKVKHRTKTEFRDDLKQNIILELNNIFYTYPGGNEGVNNISLKMYKGEILGIIGDNGSGKTTLAKLIMGLLKPNKGEIQMLGKNITTKNTSEIAREIGYVTQDPIEMLFELTVLEECAFGPKCLKLKDHHKRAEDTLRKLGLWKYKEKSPDSLSGGEKRILTIADILVNEPHILILDEPEFGLDPQTWESIAKIIKNLKEAGKTIILITHDLEITAFLCDMVALMNKGKILEVGKPTKIITGSKLLKESDILTLPFFETLKALELETPISKEEFVDTVVSFAEEIR